MCSKGSRSCSDLAQRITPISRQALWPNANSWRTIQGVMADLFGLSPSVGTIPNLEQAGVRALAEPIAEARNYVQRQPTAYLDETGWREGQQRAWL